MQLSVSKRRNDEIGDVMRVAVVTSFPAEPEQPHGGVEAVSVNLVRALASMEDLDVQVVTTDRACSRLNQMEWCGATIHRLPWEGRNVLTHAVGPGARTVREYVERLAPNVIHAHDIYGIMVKGMRFPRVFTIHGFIHADTLEAGGSFSRIRSRIWRHVEHSNWADQPHIISISPYVRERLSGIATGIIHDIDNPISASFFDIKHHPVRKTVFCAALICPRKNQLTLIDAIGKARERNIDVELRLAGRVCDDQYGQLVEQRIASLGLGEHVKLLGPISSGEVCEELANASAFGLVSFEEGSPMGIEEAMAVGVPIVTSNRCGMPYMIKHGESGFLVDPNDPQDIADHLVELLRDDGLASAMSDKCKTVASERFHPEVVAERTRRVYLRAVNARK